MKTFKFLTLKSFTLFVALFGLVTAVAITSCQQGPPKNSRATQAAKGKVHFQKYCAACHGADGTGLIIDTMAIQPANLTLINTSRRTNEFPILEIANQIDGRKMSRYHGTREMPVWGEVFSENEALTESQIKGKLGEIIAYLMSIQR